MGVAVTPLYFPFGLKDPTLDKRLHLCVSCSAVLDEVCFPHLCIKTRFLSAVSVFFTLNRRNTQKRVKQFLLLLRGELVLPHCTAVNERPCLVLRADEPYIAHRSVGYSALGLDRFFDK